jgi:hypothetical protein
MYETNGKVRKYLAEQKFEEIYFFPHLRFMKDYNFKSQKFDGLGFKDKTIWFFQIKTNEKPSKKILAEYKKLETESLCKFLWLNCEKGVVTQYGTN